MKLTCMRGYPGSGKSSHAYSLANATGAVVLNRDLLRKMFFDVWFTGKPEDEDRVTTAQKAMAHRFLSCEQCDVIIDYTNLNPKVLRSWKSVAQAHGAEFVIHDVYTPVDNCIWRDKLRGEEPGGRSVGQAVIEKMAERYPIESWPTKEQL